MEEVDPSNSTENSGIKESIELQDDDDKYSETMEKIELQDDDSFELISISCNESSKYSGGDSEDEDALITSINNTMNKPFPEIQLSSDLIQSTSSEITLTPEKSLPDDGHLSPEANLAQDIQCEIFCDDAVSLSQDDQPSSIIVMSESSEIQQPVLNTRHSSVSVPATPLGNHPCLHPLPKGGAAGPEPLQMFQKSAVTTWTTSASVTTFTTCPTTSSIREPHERKDFRMCSQKLRTMFAGDQPRNPVQQLSASVSDYQVKESGMTSSSDTKKLPVEQKVSVTHLPKVQNSPTGIWGWLCPRNLLHRIVDKAWATIDAMITTLDPQMKSNSDAKPDFEILVVTASDVESVPIRKAFKKIFLGKVVAHHLSVTLGGIPPQPVGFQSGLFCAESRIKFMREHKLVERNKIIVATSPILVEATPLRWHHTTCLMLDDPRMGLTLHTFAQTVPVPNVYANQAHLRTPADYQLRHLGFNITVGRVISIMTGISENDWQYVMTGTSFNRTLESAATVLAGTYKSYLSGV